MNLGSGTFKVATVGGIDIKVHWSWLLVLFLVTFQLAEGFFPYYMPGSNTAIYWLLGLFASILFFVSVLLHELSHSFLARARGLKVRDITLFIFGGAASIESEPKTALDEFIIAGVGPLTSFVLSGVFWGLGQIVEPRIGQVGAVAGATLLFLAYVNLMLGLFNMIPGFPLDGGRVLRGIAWAITRNFQKATRFAGFMGQLVAYGFIFWGLFQAFFQRDLGGLWLSFIGWFLLNAAQQSVASVVMRDLTRGVTVSQLMQPSPPVVSPYVTVDHLLTQYVLPYNLRVFPVSAGGPVLGMVTLRDLKSVPQEQWPMVQISQVMTPADKLRVVHPEDSLEQALDIMGSGDYDQLPVVDQSGQLLGMITRAQVLRWIQIRGELKKAS